MCGREWQYRDKIQFDKLNETKLNFISNINFREYVRDIFEI